MNDLKGQIMRIKVMSFIIHMGCGGAQELLLNYLRKFKDDKDIDFKLFVIEKRRDSKYAYIIDKEKLNVKYLNLENINDYKFGFKKIFYLYKTTTSIIKEIKEFRPDCVHTHLTQIRHIVILPFKLCNIHKWIHTLHSNPCANKIKDCNLSKYVYKHEGTLPLCITETQLERAKSKYNISSNVILLRNGVDINDISMRMEKKDTVRKRLGLLKDDFIILAVGRMSKVKNYEFLIDIFYVIKKYKPNSKLIIAGGGDPTNIENKIEICGLTNSVILTEELDNVVPLYCATDVYVMPSISEACPYALLEAQIVGCKCVVSEAICDDVICTNNIYRLSLECSFEEWAKCILWNLKSYQLEKKADLNDYDIDRVCIKLKQIYLQLQK